MEKLFLQVLDLSVIGSVAIIMVAVARLLLRRLPKWCSYLLWLAPAYLLTGIKPFASRASFDLRETVGQQVTGTTFTGAPDSLFQAAEAAFPSLEPVPYTSVNPIQIWAFILVNLWVIGMVCMLLYSLWTVVSLRLRLRGVQPLGDNVYLVHGIRTPFVMGIIRPRIYLPDGLAEGERSYILLHERTHIRRCDHMIKPLAYLLLCVHWFNPLCWLAFHLMSSDLEMSCDEAVIKKLGADVKQPYASSLLALATPHTIWCGSPLAFGEGHAGTRIKNLLSYKKPAMWAMILAVVLVGWMLVGMMSHTPYADGDWISQMYACRTESVDRQGEPIHKLAVLLPPVEGMEHVSSQLNQTERGGYCATVSYIYHGDNPEQMSPPPLPGSTVDAIRQNAIILLALNREVETVYIAYSHVDHTHGETSLTITRDEVTQLLGGIDPWEYSGSLRDYRAFYNKLQAMKSDGRLSLQDQREMADNVEEVTIGVPIYNERLEPMQFVVDGTVDSADSIALATDLADAFLSYYTVQADGGQWVDHSVTGIPWHYAKDDRSYMIMGVEYDLELRENTTELSPHFLDNGGKSGEDNLIYLTLGATEDGQYNLNCITYYRDAYMWRDKAIDPHLQTQAIQQALLSTIKNYRDGGLNVHKTMGEGFAQVPISIIWANYNAITLEQGASHDTIIADVAVDRRYSMLAKVRFEAEGNRATVISTEFVKKAPAGVKSK